MHNIFVPNPEHLYTSFAPKHSYTSRAQQNYVHFEKKNIFKYISLSGNLILIETSLFH